MGRRRCGIPPSNKRSARIRTIVRCYLFSCGRLQTCNVYSLGPRCTSRFRHMQGMSRRQLLPPYLTPMPPHPPPRRTRQLSNALSLGWATPRPFPFSHDLCPFPIFPEVIERSITQRSSHFLRSALEGPRPVSPCRTGPSAQYGCRSLSHMARSRAATSCNLPRKVWRNCHRCTY